MQSKVPLLLGALKKAMHIHSSEKDGLKRPRDFCIDNQIFVTIMGHCPQGNPSSLHQNRAFSAGLKTYQEGIFSIYSYS